MQKTFIIKIENSCDLNCGNCYSVIYGYDEEICPVCGCFIDMKNQKTMAEEEVTELYEKNN